MSDDSSYRAERRYYMMMVDVCLRAYRAYA